MIETYQKMEFDFVVRKEIEKENLRKLLKIRIKKYKNSKDEIAKFYETTHIRKWPESKSKKPSLAYYEVVLNLYKDEVRAQIKRIDEEIRQVQDAALEAQRIAYEEEMSLEQKDAMIQTRLAAGIPLPINAFVISEHENDPGNILMLRRRVAAFLEQNPIGFQLDTWIVWINHQGETEHRRVPNHSYNAKTIKANFNKSVYKLYERSQYMIKPREEFDGYDNYEFTYFRIRPYLEPKDVQPTDIREGVTNCLLKILRKNISIEITRLRLKYKDTKTKKLKELINCYVDKRDIIDMKDAQLNGKGLDIWQIDILARKLGVNVILMDQLGENWVEISCKGSSTSNKKRNVKMIVSANHCYQTDVLDEKPVRIVYTDDIIRDLVASKYMKQVYQNTDEVIGFREYRDDEHCVYKIKSNIFYNEIDFEMNKDSYDMVFTKASRKYIDFIGKNNLMLPQHLDENITKFLKKADSFMHKSVWINKQNKQKKFNSYDCNKSYPSAILDYGCVQKRDLQKHYKWPKFPTQFYKCRKDQEEEMLEKTGFCQISNVNLEKCHKYISARQYLQNNGKYPNPILKYLRSLGATFDIDYVLFNPEKTNLEWDLDLNDKVTNNKFIGRLIVNNDGKEKIYASTEQDFKHIHYIVNKNPAYQYIDHKLYENGMYEIEYMRTKPRKERIRYHYLHAYILAYSQINLLNTVLKCDYDTILKVNVDAVYTTQNLKSSNEWGEFKLEKTNYQVTERDISMKCLIRDIDLDEYEVKEISHIFRGNLSCGCGRAGFGKTYHNLSNGGRFYNQIVLSPENVLKDMIKETYNLPCVTIHNYFKINVRGKTILRSIEGQEHLQDEEPITDHYLPPKECARLILENHYYPNIVIDEGTKVTKTIMDYIMKVVKFTGQYVHILLDLREKDGQLGQLGPKEGDQIIDNHEFQNIYQYREKHLTSHRCKDSILENLLECVYNADIPNPFDNEFGLYIRTKEIKENLNLFSSRFNKASVYELKEEVQDGDSILNPTSWIRNGINEIFVHAEPSINGDKSVLYINRPYFCKKKGEIPYRKVRKSLNECIEKDIKLKREFIRHTLVDIEGNLRPEKVWEFSELAYAETIHSAQGRTLQGKIYIETYMIDWSPRLLYSALSRASYMSQIEIINPSGDRFYNGKKNNSVHQETSKNYDYLIDV
jgi:hypothetical protein